RPATVSSAISITTGPAKTSGPIPRLTWRCRSRRSSETRLPAKAANRREKEEEQRGINRGLRGSEKIHGERLRLGAAASQPPNCRLDRRLGSRRSLFFSRPFACFAGPLLFHPRQKFTRRGGRNPRF